MPTILSTDAPSDALGPDETAWLYNGLDCCVTRELHDALCAEPEHPSVYRFSLALQGPVAEMMFRGVRVDQAARAALITALSADITSIEGRLAHLVTEGLSLPPPLWSSPKQLSAFLYQDLDLPVQYALNPEGKRVPTVGRLALEKLAVHAKATPFHPILNGLLSIRNLTRQRSFLQTSIDPDGRLRCSYNIAGTTTGRFSSSYSALGTGTNLQNIDKRLRGVLVADPGRLFVNIDLEQADSRNVGAICWNLFLASHGAAFAGSYLAACEERDLHSAVAAILWPGIANVREKFYRELSRRDICKRLGHGTNYGGNPPEMALQTHLDLALVRAFQRQYLGAFPCIPAWHQWLLDGLKATGPGEPFTLRTLLGRTRRFWSRPEAHTTFTEALAFEPQSLTSDFTNRGILALSRGGHSSLHLHLQTHDSVLFSIPRHRVADLVPWAISSMQVPLRLLGDRPFIIPAKASVGLNAGDFIPLNDRDGRPPNLDGLREDWEYYT